MNIVQIISGNDNGGGARHVLNICSNNIFDMKSSIVTIGKGFLYDVAIKNNIEVVNFAYKDILGEKFLNYLKRNDIDILNFHGAKSNFLYSVINRKLNIPCAVTVHSDYRYDFLNNKLKKYIYTPLSIRGLKKFDNYICVSNYLKNLLDKSNFTGNKYVVNNGINFNSPKIVLARDDLRMEFNINKDDFVYVMVARMHPIKNHDTLIRAFYMLQDQFSDTKLLLVGDGELEESLKHMVEDLKMKDKVIFTGFKNNVLDFINASDISILTSFNEGGAPPLVVLESALLKKTVICSDVGDMNLIVNSKNGYLINPKDKKDIYNKMEKAYLNRDKLGVVGDNFYRDMLNGFSMKKFWENYYKTYLHILGGVK
ncbi:glycosyltransferase [Clostridium tyrobutyricum]|uniref:Poly(Glycerol-phosphate) alpha-glucosyltransferase n=1 Tax=Clostridium tyrobutyricum DIVETGP TaxID=1408889 RepID=W6N2Q7_CLOTY|nr:glycosyltransferase family 4 protein [Clostridium tyrobutyricum]AND84137.1 glycosyl transferase, group 1 [Clostridium tyrobutyricum]ANP68864.1 glycoside hydrolase [Clostridium tyrobutyricum]MBV4434465.1 glycosyltransferase family 4 protein [Clostridium tyrobutyricum]MBV4449895.1 glycosyltransferase family 4 protein [Clostridium tyrobutyricum]QNB66787.1 glycosyltransferase [Clostridium tyrobutyricum]